MERFAVDHHCTVFNGVDVIGNRVILISNVALQFSEINVTLRFVASFWINHEQNVQIGAVGYIQVLKS